MSEQTSSSLTPVCLIVLGMAGSGKTTFVQKLTNYLNTSSNPVYIVNLDPAVHHVPYQANIDIRDTVKFKEVMKQYGYGPNGAIMTSLNFFSSQFHKVIDLISNNSEKISYVVFDTPGQIEVFTWSASGTIITESLGASFPTVVVYVMDTPRSHNPVTFMSNMLYACSVLYRMRLPFILVLNKTDIIDCSFAIEWMKDFEAFQDALAGKRPFDGPVEMEGDSVVRQPGTSPYMNSLIHSMSLVLDEFYSELRCCGVSSLTGDGLLQFIAEVAHAKAEYDTVYIPYLHAKQAKNTKNVKENVDSINSTEGKAKKFCSNTEYQKCSKPMLVDLAGDDDEAEEDPLPNLDGIEQLSQSEEEHSAENEMNLINERFRRACTTNPIEKLNDS